MLSLKTKRPSTLKGHNVRLSNLLISYCKVLKVKTMTWHYKATQRHKQYSA